MVRVLESIRVPLGAARVCLFVQRIGRYNKLPRLLHVRRGLVLDKALNAPATEYATSYGDSSVENSDIGPRGINQVVILGCINALLIS